MVNHFTFSLPRPKYFHWLAHLEHNCRGHHSMYCPLQTFLAQEILALLPQLIFTIDFVGTFMFYSVCTRYPIPHFKKTLFILGWDKTQSIILMRFLSLTNIIDILLYCTWKPSKYCTPSLAIAGVMFTWPSMYGLGVPVHVWQSALQ